MIKYDEYLLPCNNNYIPTCLLYGFIYRHDGDHGWYFTMSNSFLTMSNDRYGVEEYYSVRALRPNIWAPNKPNPRWAPARMCHLGKPPLRPDV